MFRYLQGFQGQRDFFAEQSSDVMMDNFTSYQNVSVEAARRWHLEELLSQYATQPLTSAAHFGLATGLLLALAVNTRVSHKTKTSDVRSSAQRLTEAFIVRAVFALVSLLCAASLAPLLTLALVALALYRRFVYALLAARSPSFAGLLEGTDAVWALEDTTSRSVINVLAMFEVEVADQDFQPPLIHMLRKLIQERILTSPDDYPKFWQHRRRSSLGYFYWERQDTVEVDQHVQYMTQDDAVAIPQHEDTDDDEEYRMYGMSESVLRELLSELANSPLPCDDAASWEVLVGRDPILEDNDADPVAAMEEGASSKWRRFPVLFRVHHAMGDGVALIKLLLDTLADPGSPPEVAVSTHVSEGCDCLPKTSLIESVDLIPCQAGKIEQRPETRPAVEIPKVVVSTVAVPLAIAVGTPEYEIEKLFLGEDSPQGDSFVVIDDALDGADTIYFRKESAAPIPRCESPVPPFAHVAKGQSPPPAPRVVGAVHKSDSPSPCAEPPMRFESPVPKIHRKKYPRLGACDSSASSSDDVPLTRDAFTQARAAPMARCGSPLSRSGTPLPRNDDPVPRCNSPFRGTVPLPLSQLTRFRNRIPVTTNADIQQSLDNFSAAGLRRRRSLIADEAARLGADITPSKRENDNPERIVAAKTHRVKTRCGSGVPDNRYMRLLESIFHRPSLCETVANCAIEALSLVFAPATLIHQTLARRADANALHGRRLSGDKLVTWRSDAVGESTLDLVRRVKAAAGTSFTDVILSAVSASLHGHFLDVSDDVPDDVSVVVPARMPAAERDDMPTALENKFSVAILSLPVNVKSPSPLERLKEVGKQTALLRKSPDYLVNFWLMKVLAKYLPLPLLTPLLDSTQSTLVVSNLPGPKQPVVLAGYKMTELVFWVPNRGSTGLGVSILSYAGRLHLGLVADCALVGNQHRADSLLGDMLSEVRALSEFTAESAT